MDALKFQSDESRLVFSFFRDYIEGSDDKVLELFERQCKDVGNPYNLSSRIVDSLANSIETKLILPINLNDRKELAMKIRQIRYLTARNVQDYLYYVKGTLLKRIGEFYVKYYPLPSPEERSEVTGIITSYFRRAIDVFKEVGEADDIVRCYLSLSEWFRRIEDHKRFLEYALQAKEALKHSNPNLEYRIHQSVGVARWRLGDHAGAKKSFLHCLSIAEGFSRKERTWAVLRAHSSLGNVLVDLGEHDEALDHLLKALESAKVLGEKERICLIYNNLGAAYDDMTLGEFKELDEKHKIGKADQWEAAIYYYDKGIKVIGKPSKDETNANDVLCRILANASRAYSQSNLPNKLARAFKYLKQAEEIYPFTNQSLELGSIILFGWGVYYFHCGPRKYNDAESELKKSDETLRPTNAVDYKARNYEWLAKIYLHWEKRGPARDMLQKALELYKSSNQSRRIKKIESQMEQL